MKKVLLSFIVCLMMVFGSVVKAETLPEVTDHEKVKIYIFRGNGCPHCETAVVEFYELGDKYDDYLEVVSYEVWENSDNSLLASAVAKSLGHNLTGVPFIVVGDKYMSGMPEGALNTLVNYALEFYQKADYKDMVKEEIKKGNYPGIEELTVKEVYEAKYAKNEDDTNNTWVVATIFVVLIAGFAGLVYVGKKK